MAELGLKALGGRSDAAGALGRLLCAQLREVGEGTPVHMVRAAQLPAAAAQVARRVQLHACRIDGGPCWLERAKPGRRELRKSGLDRQ